MSDSTPRTRLDRIIIWTFSVLVFGGFAVELLFPFEPVKLSAPFFLVWWCVLTMAHEWAHALAARWVGWRVEHVEIGFGKTLWRTRMAGSTVAFKAFPIIGFVSVVPANLKHPRTKNALIYAAGPGIELCLAFLVGCSLGTATLLEQNDSAIVIASQSFVLAALAGALLNLLPFSPTPGHMSDGYALLKSPFLPRVHFESLMLRPVLQKADTLLIKGEPAAAETLLSESLADYPDVLLLHTGHARALLALGRGEEALLHLQAFARNAPEAVKAEAQAALSQFRDHL